jgi:hypothetical protein
VVRRFFELVDADRFDAARELVAQSVITFPLYRAEEPVVRGAAPLMDRMRALRARGVSFAFERFDDLGNGFVLAHGTIGEDDHSESSILLVRVDAGCIVTVEAHEAVEHAHRTVRGLGAS